MDMISGILLAAGSSSRFGSNKLMHKWNGCTAIGVTALRNLQSSVGHIVAVVREDDSKLADCFAKAGAQVVICMNAHEGIAASIRSGVRSIPHSKGWVIALADMPLIKSSTIDAVVKKISNGAKLVAPSFHGMRGHPVGFSHQFFAELTQLRGDSGAKELLEKHADELSLIYCNDPGILYDVDTPQDINNMVNNMQHGQAANTSFSSKNKS